jgi:hypothetical protein
MGVGCQASSSAGGLDGRTAVPGTVEILVSREAGA